MITPEQEEYRKQQRQEAEEQMAQMAAREAQEQADARISKGASQQLDNATPPMRKAVTDINFQVPGANNYGLKTEHNDDLGIDEVKSDSKGFATPEDPDVGNKYLKKMLREQYANDNKGYKEALARDGLDNDETNGVQSIMQAYYSGKIDKNTRDYMMADAIAKFARNTGRDIGNIGAQFTGGAINNNYETSEWDKRNSALAANETTARLAEQEGSEANLKRQSDLESLKQQKLNTEKGDKALEASRVMEGYMKDAKKQADEYRKKGEKDKAALFDGIAGEYALLTSASTSDVGMEEHVGNLAASLTEAVDAGLISKGKASSILSSIASLPGLGRLAKLLGFGDDEDDGVSEKISKDLDKYSNLAPTERDDLVEKCYKAKKGESGSYELAALVNNGLIEPSRVYYKTLFGKEVTGNDIIEKVYEYSQDPNFSKDYSYYTNMNLSDAEAIKNIQKAEEEAKRKEEEAKRKEEEDKRAQEEANRQAVRSSILNEERLPQDATPEQIQAKIDEIKRGVGSKGQKAASRIRALQSLL